MKALLEVLVEDLPPSEFPDLLDQMEEKMARMLGSFGMPFEKLEVDMTVRRLMIFIDGLPEKQPDKLERKKGPPESVAYRDGRPTKALEGFLRKFSASEDEIELEDGYVFLVRRIEGKSTSEILGKVFPEFLKTLEFKKPMRWGDGEHEFVRPVHSILALLESEIVDFEIFGLRSGSVTRGHRFFGKWIEVGKVEDYEPLLKENFVLARFSERRRRILDEIEGTGLEVDVDEELVDEIAYLTEYPSAVVGKFDSGYLDLPEEVIITTVKHHERTFATFENGRISNSFVGFQDGPSDPDGNVRRGFERVINARLEDARYYYEQDLKRPLESFNEDLKGIVFQRRLGTLYDKVLRIEKLALDVAKMSGVEDVDRVRRSAILSKADIASKVVYEFPELQGIMGRIYALASGEDEEVAWAIQEQYSSNPENVYGAVVGIADRIDTIVGNFLIGNVPSGSKDPYGLRKKMDDVFSIIGEFGWDLDLRKLFERSRELIEIDGDLGKLWEFSRGRFRAFLVSSGLENDVANAVEHMWPLPLRGILAGRALNVVIDSDDLRELRVGFERVYNMTRDHESRDYDGALLKEPAEVELMNEFFRIKGEVLRALEKLDYETALRSLMDLKPYIDRYFDEVFVMVNREDLRRSRLGFLKNVADLFMEVADLSKISKERIL